jgi:serine/threonine-protein phosphatase 2B catalytic subunit
MDAEGDAHAAEQAPRRAAQVDNAIRAIQEKKPLPEIDFSIHMMEDGTQVSTLERVCKGTSGCNPCFVEFSFLQLPRHCCCR